MKKIHLILILCLVCSCQSNNMVNNPGELDESTITKEQVLISKAKQLFNDIEVTENNIGIKVSYLYSIIDELPNNKIFELCNKETTKLEYMIYNDGQLKSQYKITLDCDGTVTTYFYENLDEEAIHIDIKQSNN